MEEAPEDVTEAVTDPLSGPKRLLGWGSGVALLLAFGSSALGADGGAGMVLLLLLLALVTASAGLWLAGRLLRDQFRGRQTTTRHWAVAVGCCFAALVCMVAVGGLAQALGTGS